MGSRRSLRNKEKLKQDEKEIKQEKNEIEDLKTMHDIKLKDGSEDEGSSSDSSVENYLKPAHEIDLNSTFFSLKNIDQPKVERKRVLSNVDRLSDSDESENEMKYEEPFKDEGKSFENLEKYHKKLEEARLAVEKYKNSKLKNEKTDIKKLLSVGETKVSTTLETYMSASSDDEMDWEDIESKEALSQATKEIPKEGVQITVEIPTLIRKKKKDDYMMQVRRRINRIKKENQVYMHKVHILCWIAHGNYVNATLNNENLLGISLSLIPSENCYPPQRADLKYLEEITRWYGKVIKLVEKTSEKIPTMLLERLLQLQFKKKEADSKKNFVLMFICILRALGLQCRLILSLRCLPLKPPASQLCSLSIKSNENGDDVNKSNEKEKPPEHDKPSTSKHISKSVTSKEPKNSVKKHKVTKETKVESKEQIIKKTASQEISENRDKTGSKKEELTEKGDKRRSVRNTIKNDKFEDNNSNVKLISKNKEKTEVKKEILKDTETKRRSTRKTNDKVEDKISKNKNIDDSKETKAKKRSVSKTIENNELDNKTTNEAKNNDTKENAKSRPRRNTTVEKPSTSKVNRKSTSGETKYNSDEEFKPDKRSSFSSPQKRFSPKNDVQCDIVNLLKGDMLQQKQKEKQKLVRKKQENSESESDSDYMPEPEKKPRKSDSADDFKKKNTTKVKQRVKPKSQIDRRVLSTDDEDDSKAEKEKAGNDVWIEVFLEAEEKWISVDVIKGQVHCVSEIHSRASTPVTYIIAWNNNLSIKDVTSRYCTHMNTITRKLRIDSDWLNKSLKPFTGHKTARDKEEDEDLARQQLDQPLPKTIGEYKNHPLYALKRHLLKFEAIYPPDAVTLGFVRNEAVYARECIHTLHSREIWIKHAKVVKLNQQPYKIVKARPKYDKLSGQMITDKPLEIFGIWQVDDYVPPTAENGKVPRNAFGNVELFKTCMLPKGTVHMQLPGLNKICRRLQIDCAPALVGFDYHSGGSHPSFDGYIVCEEFEDQLIIAWEEEQVEIVRREQEKIEKRVYDNWRKLIRGLLIREKLKHKYGFETASGSGKGKKKAKGPRFAAKKRRVVSDSESSS